MNDEICVVQCQWLVTNNKSTTVWQLPSHPAGVTMADPVSGPIMRRWRFIPTIWQGRKGGLIFCWWCVQSTCHSVTCLRTRQMLFFLTRYSPLVEMQEEPEQVWDRRTQESSDGPTALHNVPVCCLLFSRWYASACRSGPRFTKHFLRKNVKIELNS